MIEKYQLGIESDSDCLTIPKLYLKYSENIQEWYNLFDREIKGEFAFILLEFDHLKSLRNVYAGRDQIGIRPLYYHAPDTTSSQLIFTSEIKGAKNFNGSVVEYPPGVIHRFELNEFKAVHISKYDFQWVYNVKPVDNLT